MTVDVLDAPVGWADFERRGLPEAQPLRLDDEPPVDQAVFDAEFVAMLLVEAPWAPSTPAPATPPPRPATRTRRAPLPPDLGGRPAHDDRHRTASGVLRGARRRPGPGPRSPPPAICPDEVLSR